MKVRIVLTVDLSEEQVEILTRLAKDTGHTYGEVMDSRTLIRRYLESKVKDTVYFCHEHIDREDDDANSTI